MAAPVRDLETAAQRPLAWPIRALLLGTGTLFVGIGVLGIFLPLLPTTVFLLIAAACYGRSSERAYRWLMTNRLFGRYLRNYQEERGATVRTKVVSIAFLWVGIGAAAYWIDAPIWLAAVLAAIATGVTIHLVRLRTIR
ncbi:MAG: YbaN family protein [Chloroflexi bacterium]|nr:YbaN family protein [Chloroflexota bacterium]MDA1145255.1 YbaN family protein [Chloroflexota bacterium]